MIVQHIGWRGTSHETTADPGPPQNIPKWHYCKNADAYNEFNDISIGMTDVTRLGYGE